MTPRKYPKTAASVRKRPAIAKRRRLEKKAAARDKKYRGKVSVWFDIPAKGSFEKANKVMRKLRVKSGGGGCGQGRCDFSSDFISCAKAQKLVKALRATKTPRARVWMQDAVTYKTIKKCPVTRR
jgi:hypothetical protein